jgi:hypothetical protein
MTIDDLRRAFRGHQRERSNQTTAMLACVQAGPRHANAFSPADPSIG